MNQPEHFSIRHARLGDYGRMMRLINGIFFQGRRVFERKWAHVYLPPEKAYRWGHLLYEGDDLIGHFGIYPLWIKVGGVRLKTAGIGGVGTRSDQRGRGVMSRLLQYGCEHMWREGYDISILWGDRFRYGNYGWEPVGEVVEWVLDTRHVDRRDVPRVWLRPYDPDRDLGRVWRLWNAQPFGTWQPRDRLELILRRPDWKTFVTADGPFAFAVCQFTPDRSAVCVDRVVGPPQVIMGMLLRLAGPRRATPRRVSVRLPPGDQGLRDLAVRYASGWSPYPIGQVKIVNLERTMAKLLPLINARHVPLPEQIVTLRMEPEGQNVTLRIGRNVRLGTEPSGRVARMTAREAAALIFGSPLGPQFDGPLRVLNRLFPVPWFFERNAQV